MSARNLTEHDLAAIRERLATRRGRTYWRSLEELAETEAFQAYLHREFPENASEWLDPVGRRQFLKLMGASLALAGVGACTRQPPEEIIPYVRPPEEIVPGKPLFFATAMPQTGGALGVLVESHMGRPTKIEGNPDHPASLGATDAFAQASILSLYDPERSQTILHLGNVRPWLQFVGAMQQAAAAQRGQAGAGIRILTEPVISPSLAAHVGEVLGEFPEAKWFQYGPTAAASGPDQPQLVYRVDRARVIVSLDDDFLTAGPAAVRHARHFAEARRPEAGEMNRLYVVETTSTLTGAAADHRLAVRPSQLAAVAGLLGQALGTPGPQVSAAGLAPEIAERWIPAVAADLRAHRGTGLIAAGEHLPPEVRDLVRAMNETLGNLGQTVVETASVHAAAVDPTAALRELVAEMEQGRVEVLMILGGNPAFTVPADIPFRDYLERVGLRVHLSPEVDETSVLCHWHVPEAHFLETWGDARAFDGTITIQQPLIQPLYGSKTAYEVLAALTNRPDRTAYAIVREFWEQRFRTDLLAALDTGQPRPFRNFDGFWRQALHDGIVPGTSYLAVPAVPAAETDAAGAPTGADEAVAPAGEPQAGPPAAAPVAPPVAEAGGPAEGELEIVFRPDPTIFDGRFAGNAWLQELPKPVSKVTWENVAMVSPATAERLGVGTEEIAELSFRGRTVQVPIWVTPGHPAETVTVFFGYGRTQGSRVGVGLGYDAYTLRTSDALWFGRGARLVPTGTRTRLASTQHHFAMEGRHLVRSGSLEQYREHPEFVHEMVHHPPPMSLYPEYEYTGHKWGMAIDLATCTGCSACVVACQSENNIPVVGKEQVLAQREMHWLRIDRYYEGEVDHPEVYHQPVPCMHCEKAPCEVVCPVAATVHSAEGLNDMIYNRCVGTRYCSNNCPYKVRRFNFLQYAETEVESLKLMRNPDVTVRSRGVMEKCTYCVQRINQARIDAEKENRPIRDGEIATACQAACPTQAIVFGDLNDPESRVARLQATERNYALLGELNTRPRTTYLAAIRNPNPALVPAERAAEAGTAH